ncbi:hypothetical protein [Marinomonas pollencensis]|uniref:Uncharacterized protein n=1 Tax=Marinomonas pollencensis TaxID=491954 RepID=A0A3E0DHT3_9GAMM|nr:hypothetical protein [Marinomonas pollencensis]REG82161.1 hypothetical protein DFP81_11048 [Marinomonas pollencensis]
MLSELATGIVGILVGGLVGNRLAIGRDRRKEYNEIVDALHERLESQALIAQKGQFPNDAHSLDNASFIPLRRKLSNRQNKKLDVAIEGYAAAKQQCGYFETGLYHFNKAEILIAAIRKLQTFVKQR